MKSSHIIIGVAALALVAAVGMLNLRQQSTSDSQTGSSTAITPNASGNVAGLDSGSPARAGALPPAAVDLDANSDSKEPTVRLSPGQTLATVKGVAIGLKDLIPVEPDAASQSSEMGETLFQARLRDAIQRELIFQAAADQGIQLTDADQQRLAGVEKDANAMLEGLRAELGVTRSTLTPAQIEFEKRVRAAVMLQQALVQKNTGLRPPHGQVTDAEAWNYFLQNTTEFGMSSDIFPTEKERGDMLVHVRNKLTKQAYDAYDQALQQYLGQLKANSQVVVNPMTDVADARNGLLK